jgi:FkbM family methyltransferase
MRLPWRRSRSFVCMGFSLVYLPFGLESRTALLRDLESRDIMLKIVRGGIKRLFQHLGFGLIPIDVLPGGRRMRIIRHHGIRTVIDVGANIGGYGAELREYGYSGRIFSFEPTAQAFERLAARAKSDPKWIVRKTAIGELNGEATINVAANQAESSSLLPMLKLHEECAPGALYVSTEQVPLITLNSALGGVLLPAEAVMLKVDTQGYEHLVLKGASEILPQVELIECELSLIPLYEGQLVFHGMITELKSRGFNPIQFVPGFTDPKTGHNMQVDAIFSRS